MKTITEGRAKILVPGHGKVSRKMGVFYNPAMKMSRDLTIALLNSAPAKKMQIADLLAGTGIRSIRMLMELEHGKIGSIAINDHSESAAALARKNLSLNRQKESQKVKVTAKDANIMLLESTGYDYIDIDPFGCPGKFADAASQRIARGGIIAVTATDTAALAGTSPAACKRKYWATPLRNWSMHETGLRMLARRIQLAGMQHEKALTPLLSFADQHYYRIFFRCEKSREKASGIYNRQGYLSFCSKCLNVKTGWTVKCICGSKKENAGPVWLGKMNDAKLLRKMEKASKEHAGFLKTIRKEEAAGTQWHHETNTVCRRYGIRNPPQIEKLLENLRRKGHVAERAHYSGTAIKTDSGINEIARAMKS